MKNHELKPISTDRTESGPTSQGSQSGVFMVRDVWRKAFTKKVPLSLEWKSEGVTDGGSGEEKDWLR